MRHELYRQYKINALTTHPFTNNGNRLTQIPCVSLGYRCTDNVIQRQ